MSFSPGKSRSKTKLCHADTVGQFIGQVDKNKRKIFEGDIVEYVGEFGRVEYDEETSRYIISFDTWCTDFDHVYGYELEIVGNIHDNPDLTA